jgi:hypothetical protein
MLILEGLTVPERKSKIYRAAIADTNEIVDDLISVYNTSKEKEPMTTYFSLIALATSNNNRATRFMKNLGFKEKELAKLREYRNKLFSNKPLYLLGIENELDKLKKR